MTGRICVWFCCGAVLFASGCASTLDIPGINPHPTPCLRLAADWVVDNYERPAPFNWGEGVLMAGMMRAGTTTGDERYIAFVRQWADDWSRIDLPAALRDPASAGLWGPKGYCGLWGPGFALTQLHEHRHNRHYLHMAYHIVEFMEKEATRTSDGGLAHWAENTQLWVDTLCMSCPVYANFGRLTRRPGYIIKATHQLAVSARHLQDDETGLFYHMYDEANNERSPELWGRGNGWTAMAYVETLLCLEPGTSAYEPTLEAFRRVVDGLIQTQDPETGLWHTVLDREDSYLETSASAMAVYSLAKAYRHRLIELNDNELDVLRRGWAGLASRIDGEGKVIGTSAGTGPTDYNTYARIEQGTHPWGTGAFLLAASALIEE